MFCPAGLLLHSSAKLSFGSSGLYEINWSNSHPPFILPGSPSVCWGKPDVSSLFRIKEVNFLKPVPCKSWLLMTSLGLVPWQWCFLRMPSPSQIALLSFLASPSPPANGKIHKTSPKCTFLKPVFHFQASCHPVNIHRLQCPFNSGT